MEGLMQAPALFNPFPGLRPFEADEDHIFFGREKEIDELVRRLRSSRFLSVVGTSGSGKSSLVRSGLIPALQGGLMVKAGSSWRVSVVRPGADPLGNLAASLNASDALGSNRDLGISGKVLLEATLRRSTLGLVEALRQAQIPPHDNLLLVVDQFEELFRFRQGCQNENLRDEAVVFVKLLLEATQQDQVPIYVALTMRSDFIGECMEFPGLPEAVNAGMYLVPRMTRDELRSVIIGPVAVGGGQIAPRLVLRLLNDVGEDQNQLPVLQHALMRTWDHWQQSGHSTEPIDVSDYESIGELRRALSLHAEEAYKETGSEKSQRITERLFKALTDTFSDERGVRRPTSIRELVAICEAPEPEVIRIVEIFRRRGRCFLMPPVDVPLDSMSVIDISHESLMRCWARLITWADEEKRSADHYTRLSKASALFEEGIVGLWRDPELEFGLRWWEENDPTQAWAQRYDGSFMSVLEFLDRSKQERDRAVAAQEKEKKRNLRRVSIIAVTFIVLTFVAFLLLGIAKEESNRAETNLQLAKKAVDDSLASAAASSRRAGEVPDPPQLEEFRQELLNKAQDFYSHLLAKQSKSDRRFLAESSLIHSKLGDIARLQEKHEAAVQQYGATINGFEGLHRENPGNVQYRQALGYAHAMLGETLRRWSDETQNLPDRQSDVEQEYNSALRLQQDLHNEQPQNPKYQQELARTFDNRGILRFDSNEMKESESDFNEAIRLLEPLANRELDSQMKEVENPPSHDLVLAYNNLSVLMRGEHELGKAQDLSERAIRTQEALVKRDPENSGYQSELVIFHNNLAYLAREKGDMKVAKQQNHAALDSIEDLATPGPKMETQRAQAHMFYPSVGSTDHPEFHVLYMHLGDEYVKLATEYLRKGQAPAAHLAIQSLGRLLPEVAQPYRKTLEKSYQDLKKELAKSKNENK
jgi:hypothetical protein